MIKKIIALSVLGIVFAFVVFLVREIVNNKPKKENNIQVYQNKIDSILKIQYEYDEKIHILEIRDSQLTSIIKDNYYLIEKNNKELLKFKKQYNESISNVDSYNHNQLDSFFSDRYK